MGYDFFRQPGVCQVHFRTGPNDEGDVAEPYGWYRLEIGTLIQRPLRGAYLLSIPGSKETIDKLQALLYYQYDSPKVLFCAGAFPGVRCCPTTLTSFPRFGHLLQAADAGDLFQVGRDRNFVNVWMDWTGHATADTGEFLRGGIGRASTGSSLPTFNLICFITRAPCQ